MNLSPKKILSASFAAFFFLFIGIFVLSIFLKASSNPILDWLIYCMIALIFFLGFYIPFISIRWAYRKVFPKSSKSSKNPTNSPKPDKNPAAQASLPIFYEGYSVAKIIILIPGPVFIGLVLLGLYLSDPSPPQPAWAFITLIMSVTIFAFYLLFLFTQWVYRVNNPDTPIGEFYALPYAERKKVIEDKMSKTKLGRSMDKFKQENDRRIAEIKAEKVERETTKAAKKAESISIRKEIKPSNTSRIGKFFASIIYGHRRTKETINEIIKQINELDQAIMNLEFQIDSYKNSKNKLEKEIYSEKQNM